MDATSPDAAPQGLSRRVDTRPHLGARVLPRRGLPSSRMGGALSRRIDALNLREETVSEDGEAMTIVHRPPRGVAWRALQFLWGFALIHYIFYGVFAFLLAVAFRDALFASTAAKLGGALALAAYLPSFLDGSEKKLGRPWDALRRHAVWTLSQGYFPATLRRTKRLDPKEKYVFGWHPHGILILSRIHVYGGAWERLFPGLAVRVLGASPMFFLPGCREICLWMGAVDAGRVTAERVLRANVSVAVYPGGSKEIFETDPNSKTTTLVLRERKGFVRLAIRNGASLVPVFVFGEKRCYERLNVNAKVRDWLLRSLRIPLIVFWGRFFTWYPLKAKQTVVFGAPIATTNTTDERDDGRDASASDDARFAARVDRLHAEYCDAVVALFEKHKAEAGYGPEETLTVV